MKSLAMKHQISLLQASVDEMDTFNCTTQVDEWNEWRRRNRPIKAVPTLICLGETFLTRI
jgi:hypothetical protein